MDKTVYIGGKPVVFRKTAGTMLRYKRQFGRELYPDLIKIYDLFPLLQQYTAEKEELKDEDKKKADARKVEFARVMLGTETEWMYDIAYIMAQQADPSIRDELEWLDSFDEFNIFEVFIQLMPLIQMEQQIAPKNV